MSIFSHLRKSRQQAKEHNAKVAELKKKESEQVPYKHVPTHAATDAFASAPPSWREADRPRILEQNRRRSAMAASGHHMNMPGVPRVGSSLSRVSFPGEDVVPMVRMPRAYSYTGPSPYPGSARESREVVYTASDMAYLHPGSLKGKEIPRAYDSQRISPASSKGDPSPAESSSGSTSSQDDLEMKPSKPKTRAADSASAHRLHPSHSRRTSEASGNQYTLSSGSRGHTSSYTRDSRPPPSMRGFGSIPAVAAMPPMNIGVLPGAYAAHGHIGQNGNKTSSPSNSLTPTSRRSSSTSLPGLSDMAPKHAVSAPVTPAASTAIKSSEYPLNWLSIPNPEADAPAPSVGTAVGPSIKPNVAMAYNGPPQVGYSDQHAVKANYHQEMRRVQQHTWEAQASVPDHQRMDRSRAPAPLAHEDLVNVFPEMAGPEATPVTSGKSKKLSKGSGGGKLLKKKHRWSSSKAPAVAV